MTDTVEYAGCGCAVCMAAASNGEDASVQAAGAVVSDYTAILAYLDGSSFRWNAQTDLGTATVITYSFTETADLPTLAEYNPYGATAYWSYNATQRQNFRDAMAQFEAVSGIRFVEVDGTAMVNAFGADVSGVGGWANYASTGDTYTGQGYFVNAYQAMAPGDYGYQVILHEMGHALGLSHTHEGGLTLSGALDTQANSVMTYNISYPYATDLGAFDVQALQHIYGDGTDISGWTVNLTAADRVRIISTDAAETLLATDHNTIIVARGGDDLILGREWNDILIGQNGADTIWGRDGNDSLRGGADGDLIYGDHDSDFSGDADTIFGHTGDDTLIGGGGDDHILGGGQNDSITGGYGNDRLLGEAGNDTIQSGAGRDIMIGGAGADVFVFDWYDLGDMDRITDFETGTDLLDFSVYGNDVGLQYAHLTLSAFGTTDTMITVGGWDLELLLRDVLPGDLSAADFLFA